ncbi:MAG: cysteine--tRNA ligase [Erythrobacter sp.]|nr:cysteine--tRNA ligase [Erythrobacter sp.]
MSDQPPLQLFNSLTRRLEPFEPVHEGEARVYTCGPTVYNYPHIGNMRAYVFADVLGRTLSWRGYALRHVINITDVGHLTDDADAGEDKLEKAAAGSGKSIWDIAAHYTEAFKADIAALKIREPAQWSVATDYIEPMIEFAKSIADEHCYELEGGLYFDVSTVKDYGRLARAVTEEGEGRIEAVEGKRNAADFAIWRKTPPGETRQMEWDSPWGKGAPGWHLECSVMGEKLLGFPFDIHTGGIDHREIHHPNEIAQNQAFCGCGSLDEATHSGAKIWMHNNFLVERSGKMSKSSGEFLRLQLLIDRGYHPVAYRMMCLQAHYRSELEFSWEGLGAALTRLKRMVMAVDRLREETAGDPAHPKLAEARTRFAAAMADDLNTAVALVALEDVLAIKKIDGGVKRAAVEEMDRVLGLDIFSLERADLRIQPKEKMHINAEAIDSRLAARRQLRSLGQYEEADEVREELYRDGIVIMDGDPLGWEWKLQ